MTLEAVSRRAVRAVLTPEDMSGYRIEFASMSAADSATRTLLDDMLSVMGHMGLRCFGDSVTVECRPGSDGGCSLMLTAKPPVRWLFHSQQELLFALRSGALPRQICMLSQQGQGWLLTPKCRLSPSEAALLSEFGTPVDSAPYSE